MRLHRRFVFSLFALGIVQGHAAINTPAAPLTRKELAQGFRDEVILAKPRAFQRQRVDAEEAGGRLRTREKFARFGDLRVVETERGEDAAAAIARLKATDLYEFVEPDFIYHADAIPDDPSFASQWALNNTGQLTGSTIGVDIRAPSGWEIIHDAPNVIVAVIDGGVRRDHPDLAANLWVNPAPTFGDINGAKIVRGIRSGDVDDDDGHGTHVAGIIGAVGNNGVGMTGVAWRLQLMVVKNTGADGSSLTSDNIACLDYAVAHGAQVVNCSFGGVGFSQTYLTALRAARDAGVIVVCSAGNTGLNNDLYPHYPSNYLVDNIISVGNSGPTDFASASSDYGAAVDLFAPGSAIVSLDFANPTGVISKSGTSMAAPHVTGALALLRAQFPTDTYRQSINRLLRGVDVKSSFAGRALTNGRLNLFRALTTTTNRPHNDDFITRSIITGYSLSLRANNVGATAEPNEPLHAGVSTNGSLWWLWVASSSGQVTIDTTGSDFDTTLAVYAGTTLAGLAPIAANDDDGPRPTSRTTFTATSGASYVIALAGKDGAAGHAQLNLATLAPNDNFAAATILTGESTQSTGRNTSATLELGEPRILDFVGGGSLWYKWTAPRTGRFQVSAFSTSFDTLLAVYTGTALDNLVLVASNDNAELIENSNTDSLCTLNAIGGTTYYFQTDSRTTSARGEVVVSVTDALWQASASYNITGTPSIAPDGTIYVGTVSPDRKLFAVTPDGRLKWSYAATGGIDTAAPAIGADGTIYVGTAEGRIVALTAAGVVRWQKDLALGTNTSISPTLGADDTVYIHAGDGYLYALDPATGATKWRYLVNALITFASAVVAPDNTIYQASDDHGLYALNADGTLKWRHDIGSTTYATPALDAAGNIYVTTYTGSQVISVSPDGARRWTYSGATGSISGSASLSGNGGTVYIGAGDRKLHAINADTGAGIWTFPLGNTVFACTPAVDSNGVIYIGAYDGKLYAVNADGSLKRTWDTGAPIRSCPTIFGSTLYFGSTDAKLYAVDIGAAAANGPWSQYRHNARHLGRKVIDPLAITVPPQARQATTGEAITLNVIATGQGPFNYQWSRNGLAIPGGTSAAFSLASSSANAGTYQVTITGAQGAVTSTTTIVGVTSPDKVIGTGTEIAADIKHPNGNTFDQVLLQGAAASVTPDAGQILRISYVDLNNDIVQVEFTGAGTLSLLLDSPSGPATPTNYNQATTYMKGHASIVVSGANESSNLSVFTVGRANAVNQALFRDDVTYDGVADIAYVAIASSNGKFGGLRTSNTSYFATRGITGVYAPGVQFLGPVFVGDISAQDAANPVLVIGGGDDVRVTGGDMQQANGRAVAVAGVSKLNFTAGATSHGGAMSAKTNAARFEQDGVDVTGQIVVNPP